jgi:hypothetical protein
VRAWLAGSAALLAMGLASGCASAKGASPSCVPPQLNTSAALAGGHVTVSPVPSSRDASGSTQISFLGVPAGELSGVTVTGSQTGSHPGSLEAYSQGDGASFLPTRPFAPGETVTVRAELDEAGTRTPFSWSFTVAVPDTVHSAAEPTPPPPPKPSEYQSFLSRPELRPPTVTVTKHLSGTAPGDIFLAPYSGPGQYGPMILDENGGLLWFKALANGTRAADFSVQQYEGRPALTWWQDPIVIDGHDTAGVVIYNSAYQQVKAMTAGNGYQPDLHEFQITPQDTALITVYNAIKCNLSAVGGPAEGAVADSIAQEIDLKTGLVMFEWHSLDHVPLSDSYSSAKTTSLTTPFDYFHINSIDVEQDDQLLIDSRDTWTAYDVNPQTGQVQWRFGGKQSSFKMEAGTETAFQHDARQQPNGTFTFFDNGATPKVHPESRTIVVNLDMQSMTATLVHSYEHSPPLVADSQGNMQALPDGDWMVGWGQEPYFTEFNPAGEELFDAHLPPTFESYRTYRLPWSGQPDIDPAMVARHGAHGGVEVYASWNGATDVAAWRVLEGSATSKLKAVAQGARSGFETMLWSPVASTYIAVQALGADGAVLGSSTPTKLATALSTR